LHSENIIHRDLNPENIFVTENSSLEIKIGGYGLANITDDPKVRFKDIVNNSFILKLSFFLNKKYIRALLT